jgi:putative ABC transport system permease protein
MPVAGVVNELLGLGVYLEIDAVHRLLGDAPAATGALLSVDPNERAALNRRLKQLPAAHSAMWLDVLLTGFEKTIAESFRISIVTLVIFAVVIAGGVVYNAARVSLAERGRELASLRVLGFTRGEVGLMLLGEQALLTLAAIPLGLALGWTLCWLVVTRFTSDIFRIPLIISDLTRVTAVAVVLVAAVGSALIVWRRIRRLDLVAVLKTRE